MSRSYKKPYTKSKRFDKSCRCHGRCSYCLDNRIYQHKKQSSLKEEIKIMEENKKLENNQEYYNSVMNKKLAERILDLRNKETRWKDMIPYIRKEFGNEFALEEDTITGMYLEYSAIEFLDNKNERTNL